MGHRILSGPGFVALVTLVTSQWPCAAADVPPAVAAWPAVTDRPALTDEEIGRFSTANAVAETLRQQAEQRFIAELPSHETRGRGEPQIDVLSALRAADRLTAGIEEDACSRTGVSFDEYRSVYRRLLQVNALIALQQAIAAKRAHIADFERKDLRELAEAQLRFDRERQLRDIQGAVEQLERRRATRRHIEQETRSRAEQRVTRRLQRIPVEQEKLRTRMDQFGPMLEHERRLLATHLEAQTQRRAAVATGRMDPAASTQQEARAEQSRQAIEAKIERLESDLARSARRLAELETERQELERQRGAHPTAPVATDAAELALEIRRQQQRADALADVIRRGGSDTDLRPLIAHLEQQLAQERFELRCLEHTARTAEMQQAQRDLDVVLRHIAALQYFGRPIVTAPAATGRRSGGGPAGPGVSPLQE